MNFPDKQTNSGDRAAAHLAVNLLGETCSVSPCQSNLWSKEEITAYDYTQFAWLENKELDKNIIKQNQIHISLRVKFYHNKKCDFIFQLIFLIKRRKKKQINL